MIAFVLRAAGRKKKLSAPCMQVHACMGADGGRLTIELEK